MSTIEITTRLLVILVLSGLIGLEREYRGKPAGLRTNIVVGLASTLMTLTSVRALELFPDVNGFDPTRIASTIVTGIGFIGAGAILRGGTNGVIGLTTAATLWIVTGLGIAVGMGFYFEAILTTGLVFFTFIYLSKVVDMVRLYAKKNPPKPIPEEEHES